MLEASSEGGQSLPTNTLNEEELQARAILG